MNFLPPCAFFVHFKKTLIFLTLSIALASNSWADLSDTFDEITQSIADLKVEVVAVETESFKLNPVADPLPPEKNLSTTNTDTVTVTVVTETTSFELPEALMGNIYSLNQALQEVKTPAKTPLQLTAVKQFIGISFEQQLQSYGALLDEYEQVKLAVKSVEQNKIDLENLKDRILALHDDFELEHLQLQELELNREPKEPAYVNYRAAINEQLLPEYKQLEAQFDELIAPYDSTIADYQQQIDSQIEQVFVALAQQQNEIGQEMMQKVGAYEEVSSDVDDFLKRGEAVRFALLNLESRKVDTATPFQKLESSKAEYQQSLSAYQLKVSELKGLAESIKNDTFDLCPLQEPLETCPHEALRQQWVDEHNQMVEQYNQDVAAIGETELKLVEQKQALEQEITEFNSQMNALEQEQQKLLAEQETWKSGESAINARYKEANEILARSKLVEQLQLRAESIRY